MKVAVYLRVATADQLALDVQENSLREWCERNHAEIVDTISECEKGNTMNRPGWGKVLEAGREHRIDTVLVKNISRVGRKTEDILKSVERLNADGVQLISLDMPADIRRIEKSQVCFKAGRSNRPSKQN